MASSLKFGTSGLRGLAVDLIGPEARRYTRAFLRTLAERGELPSALYLGCDFRPSSPQIMLDCAAAASARGVEVVICGELPTPALAAHAMASGAPSVMITGSHIPADRNGLKFYSKDGEISKADELAISAALEDRAEGNYSGPPIDEASLARQRYVDRYKHFLPKAALHGWRVGLFEHSSVARDLLAEILAHAGATVVPLGRVEGFVPVDTEAFGDALYSPLPGWLIDEELDAIVSTDGDADRPLLMDDAGQFVRGDILGLLCARFVKARSVVTPVTSNTAIEATHYFEEVVRTRVGSPFVIEAMLGVMDSGTGPVVGFEANGGTLLGTDLPDPRSISKLMTRDAVLPILATLGLAAEEGKKISQLVATLPLRVALADRIENVPAHKLQLLMSSLADEATCKEFFAPIQIVRIARIDGVQFWFEDGTMIHFRASGNAPELRCYVEADDPEAADMALKRGLAAAQDFLKSKT